MTGFVAELEQVRFLDGSSASVQLKDRFCPARLLLPSLREARRPLVLSSGIYFLNA